MGALRLYPPIRALGQAGGGALDHGRPAIPDLRRVTVGASFASIDNSAPLFGGGERWHGDWSHLFDFSFQFFSRKDRKNKKRKREETYTRTEGDDICIAEPSGRVEFV